MAVRYLVVLDLNSPVGKMYADSDPRFRVAAGSVPHPILDCTAIDMNAHYYLQVTHSLARVGGSYQTLFLPHASVIQIIRYNEEEGAPLGFARPSS